MADKKSNLLKTVEKMQKVLKAAEKTKKASPSPAEGKVKV
ncbi:hypothetical protein ES708_34183 [subsurface metagenome]